MTRDTSPFSSELLTYREETTPWNLAKIQKTTALTCDLCFGSLKIGLKTCRLRKSGWCMGLKCSSGFCFVRINSFCLWCKGEIGRIIYTDKNSKLLPRSRPSLVYILSGAKRLLCVLVRIYSDIIHDINALSFIKMNKKVYDNHIVSFLFSHFDRNYWIGVSNKLFIHIQH